MYSYVSLYLNMPLCLDEYMCVHVYAHVCACMCTDVRACVCVCV